MQNFDNKMELTEMVYKWLMQTIIDFWKIKNQNFQIINAINPGL